MKNFRTSILALALFSVGCMKQHKKTLSVCDGLYVESFRVNPAGVNRDYLTDSVSFRFSVDRWDDEHEMISYRCASDSIYVMKGVRSDRTSHRVINSDSSNIFRGDFD